MATTQVIFLLSGTTWTVPNNWNQTNNSIKIIGAGGSGGNGVANTSSGGGGGSGAYSETLNAALVPGTTATIQIGVGSGGSTSANDTWLKSQSGTTVCLAQPGGNASGITGGIAANTARAVGNTKTAGKAGNTVGATPLRGGSGGSGASGPVGIGFAGGTTTASGGGGGGGSNAGSGSAGAAGTGANGGAGGNGTGGTGGGAGATTTTAAVAGTAGGGGGGGCATLADNAGANGGNEVTWTATAGGTAGPGGGGGGGGPAATTGPGGVGGYGGGGGGGANVVANASNGGAGGPSIIVITYVPAEDATGTLAFSGISFSGAATDRHTATSAFALGYPAGVAKSVAHHQSGVLTFGVPGSITAGWTPTPGNLLICLLHCNLTASGITVNTGSWTDFIDTSISTIQYGMGLYRYVQIGDTTALPALWSAGNTYWAYDLFEISGVSGVFASDVQASAAASTAANVSTLATPGPIVTTATSSLALAGAGQYNGNTNPTLSGGWTVDESQNNATNYGSTVGGEQVISSSGTSVSVTVPTGGVAGNPGDIILVVLPSVTSAAHGIAFNASATTRHAGTVVMSFGGVSFSGAATDKHTGLAVLSFGGIKFAATANDHTGIGRLNFNGVSFNAIGTRKETATGSLAFGGISFSAVGSGGVFGTAALHFGGASFFGYGVDIGVAGGGVRQFWTF